MNKEITSERLFELLSFYKLRDVANSEEVRFTRSYLYAVKNGELALSDELRTRLCRFLVTRSIDAMREIYGDASAKLIESYIAIENDRGSL